MLGSKNKNWELQLIQKRSAEILKEIEEKKKDKEDEATLQEAKDNLAKLEDELKSFS